MRCIFSERSVGRITIRERAGPTRVFLPCGVSSGSVKVLMPCSPSLALQCS